MADAKVGWEEGHPSKDYSDYRLKMGLRHCTTKTCRKEYDVQW